MSKSRNLREFRRRLDFRLLLGFFLILLLVGDGLILLLYGTSAALAGLLCIVAGACGLAALWAILTLLDLLSRWPDDS